MSHEYVKKIRFGEVDQAQIVYFPRLFHFCHLAMEDFFEHELAAPYAKLIKERRVGFPSVALEASFTAPLAFGDVLTITVSVSEIGTSSLKLRYVFRNQDGTRCAEIRGTTACVDMDRFASQPIPDDLRELLERHLE